MRRTERPGQFNFRPRCRDVDYSTATSSVVSLCPVSRPCSMMRFAGRPQRFSTISEKWHSRQTTSTCGRRCSSDIYRESPRDLLCGSLRSVRYPGFAPSAIGMISLRSSSRESADNSPECPAKTSWCRWSSGYGRTVSRPSSSPAEGSIEYLMSSFREPDNVGYWCP